MAPAVIRWINMDSLAAVLLLLFIFRFISSVFETDGEPCARLCWGVASGTSRRRKPEQHPQGIILNSKKREAQA
jgi:hypothetical protein